MKKQIEYKSNVFDQYITVNIGSNCEWWDVDKEDNVTLDVTHWSIDEINLILIIQLENHYSDTIEFDILPLIKKESELVSGRILREICAEIEKELDKPSTYEEIYEWLADNRDDGSDELYEQEWDRKQC